jgi:hypothetical protein
MMWLVVSVFLLLCVTCQLSVESFHVPRSILRSSRVQCPRFYKSNHPTLCTTGTITVAAASKATQTPPARHLRTLKPAYFVNDLDDLHIAQPDISSRREANKGEQPTTTATVIKVPPPEAAARYLQNPNKAGKCNISMTANLPTGPDRHTRIPNLVSDMQLIFVGTASCTPNAERGVSCLAFRFQGQTWLFDCGEGSQLQLQKCDVGPISQINKIFISHLHGDHMFGISAVLCQLGSAALRQSEGLENRKVSCFLRRLMNPLSRLPLRLWISTDPRECVIIFVRQSSCHIAASSSPIVFTS